MRTYLFASLVGFAAAACGTPHKSAVTPVGDGASAPGHKAEAGPSCEAAASQVVTIPGGVSKRPLTDDQLRMAKVAFVERCTQDRWAEDVQRCLMAVGSRDDLLACRGKLPAEAKKALGKDLRERLGRTHTGDEPPPGGGGGTRGAPMSADPCEGGE
ncbi:MAG: hypothetical protein KF773_12075 [Deltaproteobacteria bacterium]|nr:hypothetical protein [Deltaproteobacteria bacterium]